ncbi:MAG: zf-HC2 domain-containing protein [Gemmatimonadota bacterium]|uniref:zf-HC2 domain-containing protein n=1 Tax=Candidatus Palauibacter scopulicola TaxID=3056741 RepID=UPI0023904679|nr:zf-HC2 domain-containing protein [Candidatus Palauibacter scopulicola]MDE2663627.1 zf-HC2 domain-containing protein [Candidatus Palauibacter scopulicola]
MMVCKEFIERHTDYLDGTLDADERRRFDAHLEDCRSCRRYQRVMTRGLAVWRALPRVSTSPDFLPRLQHRLYHVDESSKRSWRGQVGRAAAIAVASAGLFTLGVSNGSQPVLVEVQLPPVMADVPAETAAESQGTLFADDPYVPDWFLVPFAPALDDGGGLFGSSYAVPIATSDSIVLPVERRSGQLDESR